MNEHKNVIAITFIREISLIKICGTYLKGCIGISSRLFNCLSKNKINIVLISQSSSEIEINFCIDKNCLNLALQSLKLEFEDEINNNVINLSYFTDKSIIAFISSEQIQDNRTTYVPNKIFNICAYYNIKIYLHNSSNISTCIVIDDTNFKNNINLFHDKIIRKQYIKKYIFIIGFGNIAKGLFDVIKNRIQNDIEIIGICNSTKLLVNYDNLNNKSLEEVQNDLNNSEQLMNMDTFYENIINFNKNDKIVVDCTSNDIIPNYYSKLINGGIMVVTPNKKGLSGSLELFDSLYNSFKKKRFMFETTVGAGLPMIKTLYELIESNHDIKKVEGMFSGTLNYVMSSYMENNDKSLSEIVKIALEKGYTEPNPYDDLNGSDVARKILILSRLMGSKKHLNDIDVQPLVNMKMEEVSTVSLFFENLKNYDNLFDEMRKNAHNDNCTLKYIASYENEKYTVSLQKISNLHPFYQINGTKNIIAITTNIYSEPLQIIGFGAGVYQTASGILNDILQV